MSTSQYPWRSMTTLARATVREALRTRLLWLLALAALAALGLSGFLHDLALTESRELQAAVLAATLRLAAVGLVASAVVASLVRESQDKGLELLLALPMARAVYVLGKLAGFAAMAVLPALLFGALCLAWSAPAQAALWAVSLLCELWIVAAFSLLCALRWTQFLPAMAATSAFYLLARLIGPLQLLGHGPNLRAGASQHGMAWALDGIGLLLPHLDGFTRTEWLLYHTATVSDLCSIAAQTLLYGLLLTAAALVDLHRKAL